MREEVISIIDRLVGKSKVNADIADYIIQIVVEEIAKRTRDVVEEFDFSVYDHPYFKEHVPARVIAEDVEELLQSVISTVLWTNL